MERTKQSPEPKQPNAKFANLPTGYFKFGDCHETAYAVSRNDNGIRVIANKRGECFVRYTHSQRQIIENFSIKENFAFQ